MCEQSIDVDAALSDEFGTVRLPVLAEGPGSDNRHLTAEHVVGDINRDVAPRRRSRPCPRFARIAQPRDAPELELQSRDLCAPRRGSDRGSPPRRHSFLDQSLHRPRTSWRAQAFVTNVQGYYPRAHRLGELRRTIRQGLTKIAMVCHRQDPAALGRRKRFPCRRRSQLPSYRTMRPAVSPKCGPALSCTWRAPVPVAP